MPRPQKIDYPIREPSGVRYESAELIVDSGVVCTALKLLNLELSEEDFNIVKYWLQGIEFAYWSDLQSFSGIKDCQGKLLVPPEWPTYGEAIATLEDWKKKMQKEKFDFPDVLNTWCGAALRSAYIDLNGLDHDIGESEMLEIWKNKDSKKILASRAIDFAIQRLSAYKSPQGDLTAKARRNAVQSLMGLYHVLTGNIPSHPKRNNPAEAYAIDGNSFEAMRQRYPWVRMMEFIGFCINVIIYRLGYDKRGYDHQPYHSYNPNDENYELESFFRYSGLVLDVLGRNSTMPWHTYKSNWENRRKELIASGGINPFAEDFKKVVPTE